MRWGRASPRWRVAMVFTRTNFTFWPRQMVQKPLAGAKGLITIHGRQLASTGFRTP